MHEGLILATKRKPPDTLDGALAKVLTGDTPNLGGAESLGTIEAIDPHEGKTRVKVVALRDDPVGRMARRGQLGKLSGDGGARLKAARAYQALYERTEIGGSRAIDPTREAVDGGRFSLPDTDRRLEARERLKRLDEKLGERGVGLVRLILIHKFEIAALAKEPRERDHIGRSFKEHLTTLAQALGLIGRGPGRNMIEDAYSMMARRRR